MRHFFYLTLLINFTCMVVPAVGEVRLPQLVRDSMILQRDTKLTLWGWADRGEKIIIRFNSKTYKTTGGQDGKWTVSIPPQKAGGPYIITIDAGNRIVLKDVLIGDVWICAGQSNMVHQMELHSVRYAADIANADYPHIRHFYVPNVANLQSPQTDLPGGSWKAANPRDVLRFSAVAYFFARDIYERYKVPIGLINASWGGTPIEAWMSEDALTNFPAVLTTLQKNKDTAYISGLKNRPAAPPRPSVPDQDRGMSEKWYAPDYLPRNWRPINIPGYWEDQGVRDLDGVVWFRREIDVPAQMATSEAKVFLGRIVDADALYINGTLVGNTTYLYPQRRYSMPPGLLKPGKNVFAVRVTNNGGKGGFVPDKPYRLIGGNDTIELRGEWQYKVGQVYLPVQAGNNTGAIAAHNQPGALYNSMIAPMHNYAVKGFLWYQGESNSGRPAEYNLLQPAMIADWRDKWSVPDAPFLYVQLPGFGDMSYLPAESQWAAFREAQAKSLAVSNTAMAVAIDLGEWNDIHPDRKKEVGDRLALAARKLAYGETTLVSSGPLYQSAQVSGNQIVLSFTNVGRGLVLNDNEEFSEFAIAGADKKYVWAKAKVDGDKIIVWNDNITEPKFVRYAWADSPVHPNLFNKEGLPASPFQTSEINNK